jgi:hypothetical protein
MALTLGSLQDPQRAAPFPLGTAAIGRNVPDVSSDTGVSIPEHGE